MEKTIVISLGGSLIVPDKIDADFLKKFKVVIVKFVKKGYKFAIFCGGGKIARNYQESAKKISKPSEYELDQIGICATKINAALVQNLFKEYSEETIIGDPTIKISFKKEIIIASGWKPGWSTDYDAVLLAKNLGLKDIINMSNVDYVYSKDPRINKDAVRKEKMTWVELLRLIGTKWKAGMNAPFDPVAANEARKSQISVYVIGSDLNNLENLLNSKKFKGTLIN